MIDWPGELIDVIARRRCVLVVGAGVSKNSVSVKFKDKRPSTWEDFLKKCAKKVEENGNILKLIDEKDYLTACEVIKDKMTAENFANEVEAEYQQAGYQPADIHKYIYDLDASVVLSPNFDCIYDNYATATSNGTVIIKDHTSQDIAKYLLGGDQRLIIKTHGSATKPNEIIFTRNDYAEARTKHLLFYEILKSLALTHTFLFLGCGVDDPDIRMLFEDIRFAHGLIPYHYMTTPADEVLPEVKSIASRTMRIKFLEYSSENGHAALSESLKELVSQVEAYRTEDLRKSSSW